MNLEELRMVLDTIKDVATTAGYAGIVWVFLHYATLALGHIAIPIAWAVTVVLVARYASRVWTGPRVIERTVRVGDFVISDDVWLHLNKVLMSKVSTTGRFIHGSDVKKLEEALDHYAEQKNASKQKAA